MSRWDLEYRRLPEDARARLNTLTNEIFKDKTGFEGKIDPQQQPDLARQWIAIRDQVMANQQKFARWLKATADQIVNFAEALPIFRLLDTTPSWIRIARREVGVMEIPGRKHNPRIMEYIRTCTNIQTTEAQRRYVEREGEEGVEWCSCFVNWCMISAGIPGTNHALASSWKNWGEALDGPKRGAIALFSWRKNGHIDHVAFCDEMNGQFMQLGGNQRGEQVSSVLLPRANVTHYRWPANA
jgi:uncharacterized protein (TIGR02594 family)